MSNLSKLPQPIGRASSDGELLHRDNNHANNDDDDDDGGDEVDDDDDDEMEGTRFYKDRYFSLKRKCESIQDRNEAVIRRVSAVRKLVRQINRQNKCLSSRLSKRDRGWRDSGKVEPFWAERSSERAMGRLGRSRDEMTLNNNSAEMPEDFVSAKESSRVFVDGSMSIGTEAAGDKMNSDTETSLNGAVSSSASVASVAEMIDNDTTASLPSQFAVATCALPPEMTKTPEMIPSEMAKTPDMAKTPEMGRSKRADLAKTRGIPLSFNSSRSASQELGDNFSSSYDLAFSANVLNPDLSTTSAFSANILQQQQQQQQPPASNTLQHQQSEHNPLLRQQQQPVSNLLHQQIQPATNLLHRQQQPASNLLHQHQQPATIHQHPVTNPVPQPQQPGTDQQQLATNPFLTNSAPSSFPANDSAMQFYITSMTSEDSFSFHQPTMTNSSTEAVPSRTTVAEISANTDVNHLTQPLDTTAGSAFSSGPIFSPSLFAPPLTTSATNNSHVAYLPPNDLLITSLATDNSHLTSMTTLIPSSTLTLPSYPSSASIPLFSNILPNPLDQRSTVPSTQFPIQLSQSPSSSSFQSALTTVGGVTNITNVASAPLHTSLPIKLSSPSTSLSLPISIPLLSNSLPASLSISNSLPLPITSLPVTSIPLPIPSFLPSPSVKTGLKFADFKTQMMNHRPMTVVASPHSSSVVASAASSLAASSASSSAASPSHSSGFALPAVTLTGQSPQKISTLDLPISLPSRTPFSSS